MEDAMSNNLTIILAILGSGLLSTFIVIVNDWVKSIFNEKKEKEIGIFKIREAIHKEFLKNIDFIYKNIDYLSENEKLRKKHNFFKTYRMMFLYSEDIEMKKINKMLDIVRDNKEADSNSMIQKKNKIAESFLVLRRHIVKNTKLTKEDFRHIA
jgi:hypothetical protein